MPTILNLLLIKINICRYFWLPIASPIDFKIATLTHKAVHLKQPPCLAQYLKT